MSVPRLVYDDDCGFCTYCAARALEWGEFEAVGFSELSDEELARLPDGYEECMHLLTDEAVYSCGEALERVAVRTGAPGFWAVTLARALPRYPDARERFYRWAADNRALWGRVASRESLPDV